MDVYSILVYKTLLQLLVYQLTTSVHIELEIFLKSEPINQMFTNEVFINYILMLYSKLQLWSIRFNVGVLLKLLFKIKISLKTSIPTHIMLAIGSYFLIIFKHTNRTQRHMLGVYTFILRSRMFTFTNETYKYKLVISFMK